MIEDMFFCVISIVVGGYLVSQKLRAIYNSNTLLILT